MQRRCKQCGGPIGAEKRSDAVYCGSQCRTLASDVRRGVRVAEPQVAPFHWTVIVPWSLLLLLLGVYAAAVTW